MNRATFAAKAYAKVTTMETSVQFEQTYRQLPQRFYSNEYAKAASAPSLLAFNEDLAASLGLPKNWIADEEVLALLSGRRQLEDPPPLSMHYAGHQFGHFNPSLGDGRAILIGEIVSPDGRRFDVQLKGSGPTTHSRGGDGLAPLGPVIREYLMSEFMFRVGVPTSRSLAAIATGDSVYRERTEPGGILTRVASSHIRFGTFQYFAARADQDALERLVTYVIDRHYPECAAAEQPALALLEAITLRTARLIAAWQALGFIHGVMNTDNMLICGETIDYGPCALMDTFRADQVFSSIDQGSRYAFHQQPGIGQWNLMALADALLPMIRGDQDTKIALAKGALETYAPAFQAAYAAQTAAKLGLAHEEAPQESESQFQSLLVCMQSNQLDYTQTFIELERGLMEEAPVRESLKPWFDDWLKTLPLDKDSAIRAMQRANPSIIARNHQIEFAIAEAYQKNDLSRFHGLLGAIKTPFDRTHLESPFATPPQPEETVLRTFCGT